MNNGNVRETGVSRGWEGQGVRTGVAVPRPVEVSSSLDEAPRGSSVLAREIGRSILSVEQQIAWQNYLRSTAKQKPDNRVRNIWGR